MAKVGGAKGEAGRNTYLLEAQKEWPEPTRRKLVDQANKRTKKKEEKDTKKKEQLRLTKNKRFETLKNLPKVKILGEYKNENNNI